MDNQKPAWFAVHEEADKEAFKDINDALARIEAKIDPVYDTYKVATTLGIWTKTVFGAILVVLTLWATIKGLFPNLNIQL